VLATTDDPLDSLETHALLAADPGFDGRVLPTFRPDAYLDPEVDGFAARVKRLLGATGRPTSFGGYLAALEVRRTASTHRISVATGCHRGTPRAAPSKRRPRSALPRAHFGGYTIRHAGDRALEAARRIV